MEAEDALIPAEHREWVKRLAPPLSLLTVCMPLLTPGRPLLATSFRCVVSADYTRTKAKIPAASNCLLHPLSFEFLQGPSQISHIMDHPHLRVRAALHTAICSEPHSQPFVWAFNFQLGNKTHHSMVIYFVSFQSPPKGSLMQKFLDGDDAFRNDRLKVLFRLPGDGGGEVACMYAGQNFKMHLHNGEALRRSGCGCGIFDARSHRDKSHSQSCET
ncbi:hypothetical protein L7F22_004086 [Adiantum nelumboides]|nr:hypothetical protein [Adiantum nelumboides]